jgi:hypothetical protein
MMRRAPLASCLLATGLLGPAAAEEPLANLLGKLGPAEVPQGSVEVMSWIERTDTASELVVTLVPRGQVKLVADPGVVVTPVPRDGLAWTPGEPVSSIDPERDYFDQPPTIRVPFAGEDGRPVEAEVEYAYCLVDYQCLFGTAKVSAPTEAPRG